jgi:hypothetical protein
MEEKIHIDFFSKYLQKMPNEEPHKTQQVSLRERLRNKTNTSIRMKLKRSRFCGCEMEETVLNGNIETWDTIKQT